jgi:hypothetical protein
MRVATYFTLYFIPLFETQHHGDYIECLSCQGQFKPAVLDYVPPSQTERIVGAIRADLESGTPLQMARTKLTNANIEPAVAESLVAAAAGSAHQSCPGCKLSFVPTIQKCSACGGRLYAEEPILDVLTADDADPPH